MKHHRCSYKQFNRKVEELNMPEYCFRYYKHGNVRVYRKEHSEPYVSNYFKAICEFDAYQFRKGDNEMIKKGILFYDERVVEDARGEFNTRYVKLEVD